MSRGNTNTSVGPPGGVTFLKQLQRLRAHSHTNTHVHTCCRFIETGSHSYTLLAQDDRHAVLYRMTSIPELDWESVTSGEHIVEELVSSHKTLSSTWCQYALHFCLSLSLSLSLCLSRLVFFSLNSPRLYSCLLQNTLFIFSSRG